MDMDRPPRLGRHRSLLLMITAVMLLGIGVAPAGAASPIEGVWSFNGGQIAVQSLSNGTFAGTVVVETKFAECTHPVGQQVWTGMIQQPDGSYWGLHQWYFESIPCHENPELGLTAWRVLLAANGSRTLRVCFNTPEAGAVQPIIASNGAPKVSSEYPTYHVTYGCVNSSPTAPLPVVSPDNGPGQNVPDGSISFSKAVILPTTAPCIKLSSLKIKLKDPKFDPLKQVVIRIKGKEVADVRRVKQLKKSILLKGLPSGTYTLKIAATTVLNQKLLGSRTYHSCVKKLPSSTNIKLHRPKSHRHG